MVANSLSFSMRSFNSILDLARKGKHTVFFVDAAHFVLGAVTGMVW